MTTGMRLTVVGCSGSFPGPDSAASCYLVQAEHRGRTFSLLLDLGSGALGPLQRHVRLEDVDAVALSHLHADHCLDLCGYYVARRYRPGGPLPRLPVHGPAGTADRLAGAYGLPSEPGMTAEFDFLDWTDADRTAGRRIGPFHVTVARVDHPVPAYALRVASDHGTLVYSGDTGPSADLVELARGADVLLCEATDVESGVNPDGLHLTGAQAGEHATRAGVGRLLLTHVPPWHTHQQVLSDAATTWDGPVAAVRAGEVYSIGG